MKLGQSVYVEGKLHRIADQGDVCIVKIGNVDLYTDPSRLMPTENIDAIQRELNRYRTLNNSKIAEMAFLKKSRAGLKGEIARLKRIIANSPEKSSTA